VPRGLRIVTYAVNGGGIGHLTRLVAISRWLRRYASFMGRHAEIYMLTTSEADGLLVTENLAGWKLPSPTMAYESGLDQTTYLAMAKQWIWHSLGLLRPDLLVVDTWPRGAYGELLSALDLCQRKAFIYRPVNDEVARSPDFQAMLPMYDKILVPEYAEVAPVLVPPSAEPRLTYVGPVMSRERAEQHSRTEARDRLGVHGDRLAVYVSGGGGGDPSAEDHLLNVCTALGDDPSLHLVVGAGPLYRGRVLNGDRITWLAHGGVS
jgi:predicted glycosyltransferase